MTANGKKREISWIGGENGRQKWEILGGKLRERQKSFKLGPRATWQAKNASKWAWKQLRATENAKNVAKLAKNALGRAQEQ